MNQQALPGETAEAPPAAGRRQRAKAAAAFLSFFLGVSLVLGSLGPALGRWAWERDSGRWWARDWQETAAFRDEVASYLKEFLILGSGGDLDWYSGEALRENAGTTVISGWAWETTSGIATSDPDPSENNRDGSYENDKNVLYWILSGGHLLYRNAEGGVLYQTAAGGRSIPTVDLPEGYSFLLRFHDGKTSIFKDGQEQDVYGDGIYDEDSAWFVPGYDNFPAGEGVENLTVLMAVRDTPVQYYTGNYPNGGVLQYSRMYWVYQYVQESRAFWQRQAVLLGAGAALLALWFVLRRERPAADRKIASWTVHVWTEARFLAAALALAFLLMPRLGSMSWDLWYEIRYDGLSLYMLPYLGRAAAACLENTAALLCLFWILWLIRNDHRCNAKTERRSLWRLVSLRMRKYPFQRRMTWRNRTAAILACLLPAVGIVIAVSLGLSPSHWLFFLLAVLPAAAAVLIWLVLWKNAALARDVGLLADQVEAIRSGDLSSPLSLPEDADLRRTAEALNDIQAGLRRALDEQTRSERMKVELISNVSHDLKTPLTSILSYAELLRQEELTGPAADYARVIDEKAQRLKSMVQDVFEVSKAAAGQLPVDMEPLDFAKLLRQTLADLEDPIQKSGLTFKTELPETPVMIVADGKRLYRVFQNLIDNALKYALPGSRVYLTLTLSAGSAEAALRNTSRDELPAGIDFTARFVRGDESRTDGGSGLGLSIASSFTEACGGAFRVETVADLFTAVVTFPLAEPSGDS